MYILKLRYKNYQKFSDIIKNRFSIPLSIAYSYIRSLSFDEEPDYQYIEGLLKKELEDLTRKENLAIYTNNDDTNHSLQVSKLSRLTLGGINKHRKSTMNKAKTPLSPLNRIIEETMNQRTITDSNLL